MSLLLKRKPSLDEETNNVIQRGNVHGAVTAGNNEDMSPLVKVPEPRQLHILRSTNNYKDKYNRNLTDNIKDMKIVLHNRIYRSIFKFLN